MVEAGAGGPALTTRAYFFTGMSNALFSGDKRDEHTVKSLLLRRLDVDFHFQWPQNSDDRHGSFNFSHL